MDARAAEDSERTRDALNERLGFLRCVARPGVNDDI